MLVRFLTANQRINRLSRLLSYRNYACRLSSSPRLVDPRLIRHLTSTAATNDGVWEAPSKSFVLECSKLRKNLALASCQFPSAHTLFRDSAFAEGEKYLICTTSRSFSSTTTSCNLGLSLAIPKNLRHMPQLLACVRGKCVWTTAWLRLNHLPGDPAFEATQSLPPSGSQTGSVLFITAPLSTKGRMNEVERWYK